MRLFVSVSGGRLKAETLEGRPKKKFTFKANKRGATALARLIYKLRCYSVLYSSSVDFPKENGGEDLDFRSLIEDAFNSDKKIRDDKIKEDFFNLFAKSGRLTQFAMVRGLLKAADAGDVREVFRSVK